ncbi:metal-binding protein [Blastopirellula marina]|uniref:Metal-binding protein n=1 Tax=Blastopirellula marina TaxID=124 RepID=A0A2S8G8P5_9BACT|nr:metal-binding protein [Blastopirellula marina]PQO40832.1 metal-binding protein [Blastopirellula marina]PTL45714.1 metal-binding protein [Blastopirellula marina]
MNVSMKYASRSGLYELSGGSKLLQMAPNLARQQVAFDGALNRPLEFREAISALHDVVINDLRFEPRDKTAYQLWLVEQRKQEQALRQQAMQEKRDAIARGDIPKPTADLKRQHAAALKRYWTARRTLDRRLRHENQELWRRLMPYDPVITVADDVVFFECFSVDQSSYGCLTVDRGTGFGESGQTQLGTTNVDYSWDLYESFQSLRTYRQTRFQIDPTAFEVSTDRGGSQHREEKIDLPDGWLSGFVRLQSAMAMPMRKVSLPTATLYSLLAFLKRNKAKTSPRAIRFELADGQTPRLVLEPWEQAIDAHGATYRGTPCEPIRIWGRRRLLTLSRLLPLADGIDVYLLGTGLPSFWVVRMGAMRLTLGLSGWTTNDWSAGSAVDMLMPQEKARASVVAGIAESLSNQRAATLDSITNKAYLAKPVVTSALNELALRGQVIYDLHAGLYRWRSILPLPLSDKEIAPPHPEMQAAETLAKSGKVKLDEPVAGPRGGIILTGNVDSVPCETLIDGDGIVRRGKCLCGWHRKSGIRNGPCRHIQALRMVYERQQLPV